MAPVKSARPRPAQQDPPETVDPGWILKAVGAVLAVGLLCSYITLCVFFSAAQWQFVLHPSRTVAQTPSSQHLAFESVRFGDDVAGRPQLTGWWIPGDLPSDPTVLMLHSETGSMSDALPVAKALHDARVNLLLFDYRGYGRSEGRHPSESMMADDARQALRFLIESRGIPAAHIMVFGQDLGAALATELASHQKDLSGLILLNADGDTLSRVVADQRSRIIPVGMLFHERFPLADPLHHLRTPKLVISFTRASAPEYALRAADPKMTTEIAPDGGIPAITPAVRRFLDTYMVTQVPSLSQH